MFHLEFNKNIRYAIMNSSRSHLITNLLKYKRWILDLRFEEFVGLLYKLPLISDNSRLDFDCFDRFYLNTYSPIVQWLSNGFDFSLLVFCNSNALLLLTFTVV